MKPIDIVTVAGHRVQVDRSGVGHCWVTTRTDDLPPSIAEEIAAEIIDGGRDSGEMTASNGLRYRWE